jgi:hypothetical protein
VIHDRFHRARGLDGEDSGVISIGDVERSVAPHNQPVRVAQPTVAAELTEAVARLVGDPGHDAHQPGTVAQNDQWISIAGRAEERGGDQRHGSSGSTHMS